MREQGSKWTRNGIVSDDIIKPGVLKELTIPNARGVDDLWVRRAFRESGYAIEAAVNDIEKRYALGYHDYKYRPIGLFLEGYGILTAQDILDLIDEGVAGGGHVRVPKELTIASGVIELPIHKNPTNWLLTVDTESDASSDDLDTINNAVKGDHITIQIADSGRDVRITESGNIIAVGLFNEFTLGDVADKALVVNSDGTNLHATHLFSNA